MIGASKILTVSYGTFSCTLEGFDEPFNTMKAIAEYFRDLAADDRYFGAEPPTPDAAMLHRIAERAGNRRVEAQIEDNAVILRAAAAPVAPQSPAQTPAPLPPAQPASAGLLAEESVAAKLQRIRAAVARSTHMASLADDEEAEPTSSGAPAPAGPAADDLVTQSLMQDQDSLGEAPETTFPAGDPGEDEASAEPSTQGTALSDTVLSADDADADDIFRHIIQPAPEFEDDLPESAMAPIVFGTDDGMAAFAKAAGAVGRENPSARPLLLSNAPTSIESEVLPGTGDGAVPDDERTDPTDLNLIEALAGAKTMADSVADDRPSMETNRGPLSPPEDFGPAVHAASSAAIQAEDDADESGEDPAGDLPEPTLAGWPFDPDLPEPANEAGEPAVASEKVRRARERVLRVRHPDPETEDAAAHAVAVPAAVAQAGNEADVAPKTDARGLLGSAAKDDEDVTRLLRQTNTEMDEPENRRRLSTMAHLKAAVAATVADLRSPGGTRPAGEATRLDRYRADLARVVRPRRPVGTSVTERPAPLVLVSEQRIDRPQPDSGASRVVPRRISTSSLAYEEPEQHADTPADPDHALAASRSFVDFAERLGASDMPELLEAAAAYTACIEGRVHFTRPHLMRHVAAARDASDVNREDSMRSFGTLLRQGKIEKVKRGQFTITDSSYYLAEARRMTR